MHHFQLIRPILAMLVCLAASSLAAQVVRLPAVEAPDPLYPGRTVSYPGSAAQLMQAPGGLDLPQEPERPPGARPGMFQKLIFTGGWLAGGNGGEELGTSDLDLKTILAFPIPSGDYPLIVTPGFAVHYLDGPTVQDLPARVYDAYAQFRWMRRLGPQLGIDLALTPGVFSDFEQSSDDAVRLTGYGAAQWTAAEDFKVVLGAAYIDRWSTDVLPICGVIWTPHEDVKFDLVFPHPRIARRIYPSGAYGDAVQTWLYVAGELGGGTWAIRRSGGADDVVDYTDYRVFLGMERKILGGLDTRFEVGYVFGRKIRYDSLSAKVDPSDTVMLRGGVTY